MEETYLLFTAPPHVVQLEAPAAEYVLPALQSLQDVSPDAEYLPASPATHVLSEP